MTFSIHGFREVIMNDHPFCVFKRSNRPYYFVIFKDPSGKYINKPVSTKKKTEKEAVQVAFEWFRHGVPQKGNVATVSDLSMRDVVRRIQSGDEAAVFLNEFQKQGWMKSFILTDTPQAKEFNSFLNTFWHWEKSPYIQEKLRRAHGIHRRHCRIQERAISLYWEPFFMKRHLGEITANDIDGFIRHLEKTDLSPASKNRIIQAGTKPLRWAFSKGMIDKDPTRGHILFAGKKSKRDILTPSAAGAAFRVDWSCDRSKLANMLASVTGMRSGEILALRFQDLGSDCLYVRGSWNKLDGIKMPKNNETRTVEIPFPELMSGLIELAKQNPWGVTPDSFVFWSTNRSKVPMHPQAFVSGLREALQKIGFTKDEAAKYLFHGWRHFFLAKGQTSQSCENKLN
jgi:integrase